MPINTLTPTVPTGRSTRPPGFNPNPGGGYTIIPRRGWTTDPAGDCPFGEREALLAFARSNPWLLSEALADIDPTMGKAQSNTLAATASPGTLKLVAYRASGGDPGADTRDDAATAEIIDLIDSFGPEVGGLEGLRVKGIMELLHYGLWSFEAVMGKRGEGVKNIGFVDALSIVFDRDKAGALVPFQKNPNDPRAKNGLVELNMNTFFWYAHHASVKNPYGRAVYVSAVTETLRATAFDQDLSDGAHNAAHPRYKYKYSLELLWRLAVTPNDQGGLGLPVSKMDPETNKMTYPAQEWVNDQLNKIGLDFEQKKSDDNFIVDAAGDVDTLAGGSYQGMEPVIDHKDFRQIRSLNELATTMGRPNSGSQTYTTAEFGLKALDWEALRANSIYPVLKMLRLHFLATGRDIQVKAEAEPIRRSDAVQEANADKVRDEVAWSRYLRGAITFEDYCLIASGTGKPKEKPEQVAQREADREIFLDKSAGSSQGDSTADLPQEGTTTEERDANQNQ